jgi:hypothetical protein
MKMPSSEVFFPCAILVTIIFCPTLAFIMKLIESRKNAGKSTFTFKIRNDYMYDINDRLQAILKELKYKPKKYKGQMVFYSYKDSRLPINTHSRKRYLSYTISNNTLIVEVWVTILGSEHPLDNGRYMQFSKESLLWDLEYIAKNIS